jgi:hypothetical protein
MKCYKRTREVLLSIPKGHSDIGSENEHLVDIYDRIVKKARNGKQD